MIERAQRGLSTIITKRGRAVAKIVPMKESAWDRSAVLDEAETLRKKIEGKKQFQARQANRRRTFLVALLLEHPLDFDVAGLRSPIACGDRPLKTALGAAGVKLA